MKNYCLVSFCNIYILPYAKTYIDAILSKGAKCTLLFWDRDSDAEKKDNPGNLCETIAYHKKIKVDSSRLNKLIGYFGASLFFRKVLRKAQFDGIVFLQSHAAVPCKTILKKVYKERYIVDVRDYSFEDNCFFRRAESEVIRNAFSTVISSPAYKQFLPNGRFFVAHNYTEFEKKDIEKIRQRQEPDKISISFVGTIRFIGMDKRLLNVFRNDDRFQLNYYGTGSEVLQRYCKDNDIKNVDFHGSFSSEKTTQFYWRTSLINNLYGNHDNSLDYAVSNKLYHAAQFYIPILVCPDTYMEKIVLEYGIGFVFDVNNPKETDRLYSWYKSFDRERFKVSCDKIIEKAKRDNSVFLKMVDAFLCD